MVIPNTAKSDSLTLLLKTLLWPSIALKLCHSPPHLLLLRHAGLLSLTQQYQDLSNLLNFAIAVPSHHFWSNLVLSLERASSTTYPNLSIPITSSHYTMLISFIALFTSWAYLGYLNIQSLSSLTGL